MAAAIQFARWLKSETIGALRADWSALRADFCQYDSPGSLGEFQHQDRAARQSYYAFRHAPEQQTADTAAAVRWNYDQVRFQQFCSVGTHGARITNQNFSNYAIINRVLKLTRQ